MNTFQSVVVGPVGAVNFPEFRGAQLYMHPFSLSAPELPPEHRDFAPVLDRMLADSGILLSGLAFFTIDQRTVGAGESHRRGGPHVDGNFIFDWGRGGGGWLTGVEGRTLSPEDHALQYCNPLGGMILASDIPGCRAWVGEFEGQPKQGGNCAHLAEQLKGADSILLEAAKTYVGNSTCVHESVPFSRPVNRTFIRVTLPPTIRIAQAQYRELGL